MMDLAQVFLEASPIPELLTDELGRVVYVNRAFTSLTGLSVDAAIGTGWLSAIEPSDRAAVASAWRGPLSRCEPWDQSLRLRDIRGRGRRSVRLTAFALLEGGELLGFSIRVTPIERRERPETDPTVTLELPCMGTRDLRNEPTTLHALREASLLLESALEALQPREPPTPDAEACPIPLDIMRKPVL